MEDLEVNERMVPSKYIQLKVRLVILSLLFTASPLLAGNQLIDAVMRSDFIFDRNVSNVPFIPLAYVNFNSQSNLEFKDECIGDNCEFDFQSVSQGLALPVWVGKQNMVLLGESFESKSLNTGVNSIDINSAGILAAWVSQPSEKWQAGAFIYTYRGIGEDELARESKGNITGAVARYRHSPHFHSYWGMVRLEEYNNEILYPYIGFDWYIGKEWSVSGLIPWPTVQYAPSTDSIYKFGALYSGAEWLVNNNDNVYANDFEKWDFGIAYEHRLWNYLWGEIAVGYSGLGKFYIRSGTDIELDLDIENTPFIKLGINVRFE